MTRKQVVYLEQEFKLTKITNFVTLKDMCCDFWGLKRENYSLYDAKFGHLMALNSDQYHPAHSVSDYFEVLKMRYPSLYLLKDERTRTKIEENAKASVTINAPNSRSGANPDNGVESSQSKASAEAALRKRNFQIFNRAFPG